MSDTRRRHLAPTARAKSKRKSDPRPDRRYDLKTGKQLRAARKAELRREAP